MPKQPPPRAFAAGSKPAGKRKSGSTKRRKTHAGLQAAPHRARKPRPADVRRTRQRVLTCLYAVLGIEIGMALLTSPALAVKRVRVSGTATLTPEERAQTLAALQVRTATNWFRVPMTRLRQDARVLPWARAATVERSRSTTLFAHIEPRRPFFACRTGSTWWEMDSDCIPIRLARPAVANRLPRVVLQPARVLQPGVPPPGLALPASVQILREIGQEPGVRLAKITIDPNDNLALLMRDGLDIKLGQADNIREKAALLKRIYARDPAIAATIATVNLSCPTAPACTPKLAQAAPDQAGAAANAPAPGVPQTLPPMQPRSVVQ